MDVIQECTCDRGTDGRYRGPPPSSLARDDRLEDLVVPPGPAPACVQWWGSHLRSTACAGRMSCPGRPSASFRLHDGSSCGMSGQDFGARMKRPPIRSAHRGHRPLLAQECRCRSGITVHAPGLADHSRDFTARPARSVASEHHVPLERKSAPRRGILPQSLSGTARSRESADAEKLGSAEPAACGGGSPSARNGQPQNRSLTAGWSHCGNKRCLRAIARSSTVRFTRWPPGSALCRIRCCCFSTTLAETGHS